MKCALWIAQGEVVFSCNIWYMPGDDLLLNPTETDSMAMHDAGTSVMSQSVAHHSGICLLFL